HALLPEPLPTLRTRSPPALLPPPCAAPHTLSPAPAGCRLAPATRSDPVFHSLSAATLSASQTPAGSCTPATAAPETHATHCSCPSPPLPLPHSPPSAAVPLRRTTTPPLPARPRAAAAPPRSPPTQCGARALSPAHPRARGTPTLHRSDTAPRLPSGTTARRLRRCTGPAQTAWQSVPAAPGSHGPSRRRPRTSLQPLPLATPPSAHPARRAPGRPAALRLPCRSRLRSRSPAIAGR